MHKLKIITPCNQSHSPSNVTHYYLFVSFACQLLTAHQQELEEIMEKMDLERQRQQANLHQKLLERKKRKQEAQQRKQEREMAKELLEQKKELQEVRTQHVSETFSV